MLINVYNKTARAVHTLLLCSRHLFRVVLLQNATKAVLFVDKKFLVFLEAEYAFQLKKPIIPLMMEENYKPDGWLGMIVGAKLWYDFRPSARIPDSLEKLSKELTTKAGQVSAGGKH